MIKHVVMMKFKPGAEESRFSELEKLMGKLPDEIPQIQFYQFGLDIVRSERSYDFGLVSEFDNVEALKTYQTHPKHLEALEIIKELFDSIIAVDFVC